MAFCSTVFIFFFLPIVFAVYLITPSIRLKNLWVLLASLFFYAFGEPIAVLILILSGLLNYLFGLGIGTGRHKKAYLTASVIFNLGTLCLFKYIDFFIGIINSALNISIPKTNIALPIGISFFTFQAMSYVIDVYRGSVTAQKSFLKVLLYLALFPQLVAGPIVKYYDVEKQIDNRSLTSKGVSSGIVRFVLGLSKKLLIANTMASVVDKIFALSEGELTLPLAWLGAICYMLQIYFDFSGYSDMAIGLGKMFGFEFKENFNYPYISSSVKDFWRRWHISVSSWFKEYLYIPLGGNRKGKLRTYINKLIVFFCTGLWHGANLTFILWGMLHGMLLLFEGATGLDKATKLRPLRRLYTIICVCLTFVIFRADSIGYAFGYIKKMFLGFSGDILDDSMFIGFLTPLFIVIFLLAFIFSTPIVKAVGKKLEAKSEVAFELVSYIVSALLLVLCILNLSSASYNPFIYFRF